MKTLEEILKGLAATRDECAAYAEAWEAATVEKKKSGEEFASLARALKGAKMGVYAPIEDAAHPYATIYTHTAARGYTRDTIPLFT